MEFGAKLEALKLTADEITRLDKALKDEKFREILHEYVQEISNPENKKKYEEEIKLLEQERGMDVQFIHPKPYRVLKTSADGKQKCFINVCSSDLIDKPACKAGKGKHGRVGQHWSLPYSLTPGRPDRDSKGNKYKIYDVVFHPDTLYMAGKNARLMEVVDSTAIQGVQDGFKVKLDKNNVKILKIQYKGVPHPAVIRKPMPGRHNKDKHTALDDDPLQFPYPYPNDDNKEHMSSKDAPRSTTQTLSQSQRGPSKENSDSSRQPTQPHYTLKYRSVVDLQDYRCSRDSAPSPRPKEIIITIDLPLLKSAADAELDVTERLVVLKSPKTAYRLDVPLAYPVDENKGEAKFNKLKKELTVTLPVLPLKAPLKVEGQQLVKNAEHEEENMKERPEKMKDEAHQHYFQHSEVDCSEVHRDLNTQSLNSECKPIFSETEGLKEGGTDESKEGNHNFSSGPQTEPSKATSKPDPESKEVTQDYEDHFKEGKSHSSLDMLNKIMDDVSEVASVILPDLENGQSESDTASQLVYEILHSCQTSEHQVYEITSKHCTEQAPCDDPTSLSSLASCIPDNSGSPSEPNLTTKDKEANKTVHFSEDAEMAQEEQVDDHASAKQSHQGCATKLPSAILRETNPEDGSEVVISDHTTSAAFSFQNSLLYELD